jgi:hypothetical protein
LSDATAVVLAQHETQRLLGRCLLRIQQYERLLKTVLGAAQMEILAGEESEDCANRRASFATMTMGGLASELFNSVVVVDAQNPESPAPIADTQNKLSARVQHSIVMDADRRAVAQTAVHDIVQLRNGLVHHFIQRFNLRTEEGCLQANEFLISAFKAVDDRFSELTGWAKSIDAARVYAAAAVSSPEFENLMVNGIQPNGDVVWEISGIVSGLREAFEQLATNGWVSLEAALEWMSTNEPEQTPERYGCSSWKEVVHKSRVFRMRYRTTSTAAREPGFVFTQLPKGS